MLSVIVYGRNDSHGYNPHKRVALSLNSMAHLMDDPDDEIIFVDYNTPDDLSTFVEAIQDTLTDQAKRRLRILRVRPTAHDRLRGRTHLRAVESIARNIGARRSNPANRWLLSSNTDMIFVPREAGRALSTIAAELEDGFYCLPRFELPESFWESLDRMAAAETIARVGQWGTRFHINEIVYGSEDILYDAPGDFQLMLRQDLFEIEGFDERMILGWHVDSNISRRLRLLRGTVRSAADHLHGYHCDHTRQVTLLHGRDRVEDDWKRFVQDVDSPYLPNQHDRWGLAGEDVEEVFLPRGRSMASVQALAEMMNSPLPPVSEPIPGGAGVHDPHRGPERVLPYVCDVLSNMPRHWSLAYVGSCPRLYALVQAAWERLGFTGDFLRPVGFEHLGDGPVLPAEDVYDRATLILAEFGDSAPDGVSSTRTKEAFEGFVRAEAARSVPPGQALRHFITIDPPHASGSDSMRVHHGHASNVRTPAPALERRGISLWLQKRLGRQAPVPVNELSQLLRLAVSLLRDGTVPDDQPASAPALMAVPLLALLDHPDLPELTGATLAQIAALRDDIAARRPSRVLRDAVLLPVGEGSGLSTGPSRTAAVEAWEDPDWRFWAHRHFGGTNAYNYADRGAWTWERVHVLHTLDRLGVLAPDKAVLVVAGEPDALYAVLTQHVGHVDVANPGLPPKSSADGARWHRPIELVLPERLTVVHQALADTTELRTDYDAVIFVGNRLFGDGPATVAPLLAWAEERLRLDGVLAFSGRILLNGDRPGHWLTGRRVAEGEPERLLADVTGLEPIGAFDATVSAPTLDRLDDPPSGWTHHGHFVAREGNALFTMALWFLRRRRLTTSAEWKALSTVFEAAAYGDLMEAMLPGEGLARGETGVAVDAAAPGGMVLFGPYLRLPAGRYRLTLDVTVADGVQARRALLNVAVIADGEGAPLAWWDFAADELTAGQASLIFDVPQALGVLGGRGASIEFPINHFGGTGLTVRAVRLTPEPAASKTSPHPAVRLLPLVRMVSSDVAEAEGAGVTVAPDAAPTDLLYGPNLRLPAGTYRLSVMAEADGAADARRAALTVAVMAGDAMPEPWRDLRVGDLASGCASVVFDVPVDRAMTAPGGGVPYEFRIGHLGGLRVMVADLRLERLPAASVLAPDALSLDALARMVAAEGIARNGFAATAPAGEPGLMLFGPYLRLPGGGYRLTLAATVPQGHDPQDALFGLRVVAGKALPVLWRDLTAGDFAGGLVALDVTLPGDTTEPWEFQLTQYGRTAVTIEAIDLLRLKDGEASVGPSVVLSPLGRMPAAEGVRRAGARAMVDVGERAGLMLFGPYVKLLAGAYRLTLAARAEGVPDDRPALSLEIAAGGPPFLMRDLPAGDLAAGPITTDFLVTPEQAATDDGSGAPFEFRIGHLGTPLTVSDLRLVQLSDPTDARPPAVSVDIALLPRLTKSDIGKRIDGTVQVNANEPAGTVLFGPYIKLPAGRYEVTVTAMAKTGLFNRSKPVLTVQAVAGGGPLAHPLPATAGILMKGTLRQEFTVTPEQAASDAGMVEVVFTHTGQGAVTIRDARLRQRTG